MLKKQKVSCLSTRTVWGKLVGLHSHHIYESSIILVTKTLTVGNVQKIVNSPPYPCAVIVENGSFAGHPSVLLNSKGIQLVVIDSLPDNYQNLFALIDGHSEDIFFSVSGALIKNKLLQIEQNKPQPIIPAGFVKYRGENIRVNVDGKTPEDLQLGFDLGASGVGILRTDWLGWDNQQPPTLDEHYQLYTDSIKVLHGSRLNIRLFDIGGDKIPNWALVAKDEIRSPLGLRGIRSTQILKLAFDNQLNAIAKVSQYNKVGIVLPMISFPGEVQKFKTYFGQLSGQSNPHIKWGSMVETPSSALLIKDFYKFADFVRIGPGDLSQFTLATLRENISPKHLSGDTLDPAVIKLIKIVMTESKKQGKEANMCLDVEPRKPLLKQLLKVGVRTFNVSSLNIPTVFSLISQIE